MFRSSLNTPLDCDSLRLPGVLYSFVSDVSCKRRMCNRGGVVRETGLGGVTGSRRETPYPSAADIHCHMPSFILARLVT